MIEYSYHSWALVLVVCLCPHLKCVFSAGGDIIKEWIFRLVKWLKKRLHKEKKQPLTINVEATNSIVILTIYKD